MTLPGNPIGRRALGGLVAGAALAAPAVRSRAAAPVRIGAIVALSPPGSVSQGSILRDTLGVARDLVNAGGGVLGRPVELLIEDHQGLPEKARAAAEKLITLDGVAAIVGEHQSSTALAAMEVVHAHGIPYVNANASADAIRERGYREVFNVADTNRRIAGTTAGVLAALKAKRVLGIAENTDFGTGLAKNLGTELHGLEPGIEYRVLVIDRTSKDFSPVVLPLQADPPDAIVQIAVPPAAYILLSGLHEQGVAPSPTTWVIDETGSADFPDFWRNVGDAGRGLIDVGNYHPGMRLTPLGDAVAAAYRKATGGEPNRLVLMGADSLLVAVEAIRRANSAGPAPVVGALEKMDWPGTRGTITFDATPDSYRYHQWMNAPEVVFQFTEVGQAVADSRLVQVTGQPLDTGRLQRS